MSDIQELKEKWETYTEEYPSNKDVEALLQFLLRNGEEYYLAKNHANVVNLDITDADEYGDIFVWCRNYLYYIAHYGSFCMITPCKTKKNETEDKIYQRIKKGFIIKDVYNLWSGIKVPFMMYKSLYNLAENNECRFRINNVNFGMIQKLLNENTRGY